MTTIFIQLLWISFTFSTFFVKSNIWNWFDIFFFFGKILHSFYSVSDFVNFSKKLPAVSHCADWERPNQLYQGPAAPIFSGFFNFRVVFYLSTKRFCMWIKVCLHKEIYRYVIRSRICLYPYPQVVCKVFIFHLLMYLVKLNII